MRFRRTAVLDRDKASGRCDKHSFEAAAARCSSCDGMFCGDCVVMPFGPRRPLCVGCALVVAGLRRRPVLAERAS